MSSDEEFSLVVDPSQPSEDTLNGIQVSITNYKKQYDQLMQEQKELADARDDAKDMTQKFKERSKKLAEDIKKEQKRNEEELQNEKLRLELLLLEERDLLKEIERVKAALREEEVAVDCLKQQNDVFTAVPEKKFIFSGKTDKAVNMQKFEMKAHIVYPMDEGTALVTFEDKDVAKNILKAKQHQVDLGSECRITLEARPVHLMLPSLLEMDTDICPQRILISNLPKMDTETMLNKLEIHFSKSKNGGGEVEACDMLPDSGTVVIAFLDKDIAKRLTEVEYHEVKLQENNHRVRVTPFLNGKITNLETKMSACSRTVLLTGIPNVMEQDTLQDVLEIHFQKMGNGGGEIEAFLYNPMGQKTSAVFEEVST
ncbi:interferon-induced protein 35 [Betta splendens]|uniref:Interferon-induced protein 35 n=1 Tax=Betta splendens TaxID=158456 RepID=A0A6P7N9Y3_BETSP|nr:interferon-induced protein 35 [Betta splendens]